MLIRQRNSRILEITWRYKVLNSRGMTLHALGSMPSFADILRQTM